MQDNCLYTLGLVQNGISYNLICRGHLCGFIQSDRIIDSDILYFDSNALNNEKIKEIISSNKDVVIDKIFEVNKNSIGGVGVNYLTFISRFL